MRYVLEIPRTWHDQLVRVAQRENTTPRLLLIWIVKTELSKLDAAADTTEPAAA